jgi:hypothetical protein
MEQLRHMERKYTGVLDSKLSRFAFPLPHVSMDIHAFRTQLHASTWVSIYDTVPVDMTVLRDYAGRRS